MSIGFINLLTALGKIVDLADTALANHHARVACIGHYIAEEMGFRPQDLAETVAAGLLHDIGAFTLIEKKEFLHFDVQGPARHGEIGYLLTRDCEPLAAVASVIRHHHARWDEQVRAEDDSEAPNIKSHILHLADRVAVLMGTGEDILSRFSGIVHRIRRQSGAMFAPNVVDAFLSLSRREVFWLETSDPDVVAVLTERCGPFFAIFEMDQLEAVSRFICRLIDFRSRYTATHSHGVAATAEAIALLAGFSQEECRFMRIAGLLHDVGKLGVPVEILDKPSGLTPGERNLMKTHVYLSHRVVRSIKGFAPADKWVSHHHESPDGAGYPWRLKGDELCKGARVLAVADVFVALSEERPYRDGMPKEEALGTITAMARSGRLDDGIVGLLLEKWQDLDQTRRTAQAMAAEEYRCFDDARRAAMCRIERAAG